MMWLNDGFWANVAAVAVIALGGQLVWRGVRGSRAGDQGVLRTRSGMLGRLHGFRLAVFGLTLIGAGAAILWQAQWLLLLAIGIGFVEILESSVLIAFWGRSPHPPTPSSPPSPPTPSPVKPGEGDGGAPR